MNEIVDIISLDNYIKKKFADEEKKIGKYKEKLGQIDGLLSNPGISSRVQDSLRQERIAITSHLKNVENDGLLYFYIIETNDHIEKYKEILEKPLKLSFMGKKEAESSEKKEIIKSYLEIAKKYIDLCEYCKNIGLEVLKKKSPKIKIACAVCGNRKSYEIIEGKTFICSECGFQEEYLNNLSSFKDVNRVNISSKYTYERRIHFRDCINQYQGKQNSTVTDKVIEDIEVQLRNHCLENVNKNGDERWSRVSKEHILLFLRETGHTKHYEDVFLIFNKITGKKLDDISHLEPKLMEDFDKLSALYDKKFKQDKKITRKSFINTQYVLYQLLRRHRHPCRKDDFNILKTLDRKSWHDDICKELFEELGWNFFPSF